MSEFRSPKDVVLTALREECQSLLAQCTEKQQELFSRLFRGGISSLDQSKLSTAITLCQRTITKNRAAPLTKGDKP